MAVGADVSYDGIHYTERSYEAYVRYGQRNGGKEQRDKDAGRRAGRDSRTPKERESGIIRYRS